LNQSERVAFNNTCLLGKKRNPSRIEAALVKRGADTGHPGIEDLAAADQPRVDGLDSIIAFANT